MQICAMSKLPLLFLARSSSMSRPETLHDNLCALQPPRRAQMAAQDVIFGLVGIDPVWKSRSLGSV